MPRPFTTIEDDGWALLSAESYKRQYPDTFSIPPSYKRTSLRLGDAAKLLFDIETREDGQVIDRGVDRMWVIVTGFDGLLYIGVLHSNPGEAEGLELRPGTELAFRAEHICAIDRPPDDYLAQQFGDDFIRPG